MLRPPIQLTFHIKPPILGPFRALQWRLNEWSVLSWSNQGTTCKVNWCRKQRLSVIFVSWCTWRPSEVNLKYTSGQEARPLGSFQSIAIRVFEDTILYGGCVCCSVYLMSYICIPFLCHAQLIDRRVSSPLLTSYAWILFDAPAVKIINALRVSTLRHSREVLLGNIWDGIFLGRTTYRNMYTFSSFHIKIKSIHMRLRSILIYVQICIHLLIKTWRPSVDATDSWHFWAFWQKLTHPSATLRQWTLKALHVMLSRWKRLPWSAKKVGVVQGGDCFWTLMFLGKEQVQNQNRYLCWNVREWKRIIF